MPPIRDIQLSMKIAIADSGAGGLFVAKKLLERTRAGKIIYFADTAHSPYGSLSERVLTRVMRRNCAEMAERGAQAIVLACNTATAVCIDDLRREFGHIVFIGTEPAIRPAAAACCTLTVMATPLTLAQPRFAALLARSGVRVNAPDCSSLARLVERDFPDMTAAEREAERILSRVPRGELGAVVIGCTHYSWLAPFIKKRFGCSVFDGADGVVSHIVRKCAPFCGAADIELVVTDPADRAKYERAAARILDGISR